MQWGLLDNRADAGHSCACSTRATKFCVFESLDIEKLSKKENCCLLSPYSGLVNRDGLDALGGVRGCAGAAAVVS
jgi:hypothetical protein